MNTVKIAEYPAPPISRREILRYMSCPEPTDEVSELLNKCISEAEKQLSYRVAFCEQTVSVSEKGLRIGDIYTHSHDLEKALSGCKRAIVFAATVGLGIDRLINKYSRLDPAKALCLQAIGAERAEALCNTFCRSMALLYADRSCVLRPRFSPGYGDLPISLQREIFSLLMCEKAIGLTLNDSLLMSPTKSVTAMIGIFDNNGNKNENT